MTTEARLSELETLAGVNVVEAVVKTLWSPEMRTFPDDTPTPARSYKVLYLKTNAKEGLYRWKVVNIFRNGQLVAEKAGSYKGGVILMNVSSWPSCRICSVGTRMLVQQHDGDEDTEPYTFAKFKNAVTERHYVTLTVYNGKKKGPYIVTRQRMLDILEAIKTYNAECKAEYQARHAAKDETTT